MSFYGRRREREEGHPLAQGVGWGECRRVSHHQRATARPMARLLCWDNLPMEIVPSEPHVEDARWFTTVPTKLKAISEKTKESKTRRELQLEKKCYHTSWQHQDHPACQQNWVLPTTSRLGNHILQSNASQMFPNEKSFF